MSTSDEWINVINAIENSTRIFLTTSIRFLVFCGVDYCYLLLQSLTLPGGLLGADWTKRLKTSWHWVDVCWRDEKKDSESPGRWNYFLQLLEEDKRQSSKFFLKRHFGGQSKLLNLAGQTVNYGALNGLIIVHVLTERFNKWFHLIIYAFNDLKIPDQIHHCTRTNSMIILWQTVSSNILRIYFSSNKISTCLRNNETWYNEKNQL